MLEQNKSFMKVKNAWKAHTWNPTELNTWTMWCHKNPITNKKGETVFLFPYTAFLKVNIPRVNVGISIIYEPPND